MNTNKITITPDTKVGELLTHYPELEELLQRFSPAFAALKNPVLRRTVAKVTTLQQAAKVAQVNVVDMVDALRQAAGMPPLAACASLSANEARHVVSQESVPDMSVTHTLDARPMLESGDHPKERVLAEADRLHAGECMELLTPFPPVPLIGLLENKGFQVTMHEPTEGVVRTFICRPKS